MPRIKKPKPYPDKGIIKGALRRVFARSPICRDVINQAIHPTAKGVRGGKQYVCALCRSVNSGNNIQVDHEQPVVPLNKTVHDLDYNQIVERIFCNIDNLQVICRSCHDAKTKEERVARKTFKQIKLDLVKHLGQ